MKRKTLLCRLEKNLPSFSLEFIRWGEKMDKSKDLSWLFEDDYDCNLPVQIPRDFLVGAKATVDGDLYVLENKRECGRVLSLDITDFGYFGNTHKYGELFIDGVKWICKEKETIRMCRALDEVEPRAAYTWKVNICKIIRPEDGFFEADGYESGERTKRFTQLSELYGMAAYVALFRVLGPFELYEGSHCCVHKKKDLILSVDENDNITIGRENKHYWNQYFETATKYDNRSTS